MTSPILFFLKGLAASLLGFGAARYFFPQQRELASACFTAIGLITPLQMMLEDNRTQIWEMNVSPWKANELLARKMVLIFLGIVAAAFLAQLGFFGGAYSLSIASGAKYSPQLLPIIQHNLTVLGAALLVGLIYREIGLALILAWNGLHWSKSLVFVGRSVDIVIGILPILPHLVLELTAYVLVGLAGSFVHRAIKKYAISSAEFYRVAKASVAICGVGLITLLVAALFERYLATSLTY